MGGHLLSVAGPFVGRARELHLLELTWAAAARGEGSVTLIAGEAGIGKTRLCDEAAGQARAAGLTVVASRCWLEGGAPALWPWHPIVHDLCGADAARLLGADRGRDADAHGADAVDPDRFARFAAVTDRLAAAAERTPVCLVIDDVHAADAGTLLLLRFVARSLPRLRMAIVLTRRSGGTPVGALEERLLHDIEAEATPLALRRFDDDESVAFLVAHGLGALDRGLLGAVVRVSGGNPLHLRRIAALGEPHADQGIPEGLQVAIEASVGRLGPTARRLLAAAALLGLAPSVVEAAEVAGAGAEPADVLDAAAEAAAAKLVHLDGTDRFTFGHELVRATFAAGLSARERLDVHARAAQAVAGEGTAVPSDRLARRAHHAFAAAPRSADDARRAVAACRAAAAAMVGGFAYEQADALLSSAVGLHDGAAHGPAPVGLLVEWAQAALLCGRLTDARRRFDRAATAAEREDDATSFAEAALGLGGHWLNEHRQPVERARVLGLQRAALGRLGQGCDPPAADALRVRLDARLAAEDVYDGGPVEPVLAALAAARACPDLAARAEALSLVHHALLAPEHADLRLELADELVGVASEAGHGVLALMGLCWRAVDLFLLGDDRAGRALEDLRERADALACRNILYIVDVLDVMRLAREGRLDDAEAASQAAYELGTAVGEVDAFGYVAAHTLAIRWIQGRDAELLETAQAAASSTTLVQGEFAFHATYASLAARAGRRSVARAELDRLAADGLDRLPRSSNWLVGMAAIAETAVALGDGAVAGEAYDLLLPFADRPVMPSLAVVCLGSTERTLGLVALALGDADRAVGHCERALAAAGRLANRPLVAIAQADLARARRRRSGPGDAVAARALLDDAIGAATALGLTGRVAAWQAERAEWGDAGAAARAGVLRREGQGWLVGVDDRRVFVPDLVGLAYLAELVRHPGQPVTALALAGAGDVGPEAAHHEVLDEQARAAYGARLQTLTGELAEADDHGDRATAERLRAEFDALVDQLEAATGLHGRPRTFTHRSERARTAVRKAIKRALDEIDALDPLIAAPLRSTITTGATCTYTPHPTTPITWST